ncbi:MAG TPA: hypothetical protein VH877_05205 [Polyangia bacterium]|nr:hypothetical protein [Polyangia bacterium]
MRVLSSLLGLLLLLSIFPCAPARAQTSPPTPEVRERHLPRGARTNRRTAPAKAPAVRLAQAQRPVPQNPPPAASPSPSPNTSPGANEPPSLAEPPADAPLVQPPPNEAPAMAPAAAAESSANAASKIIQLYDDFRALKDRLPFGLGAGVYLFYYQPVSRRTTLAGGSLDGVFEVYAFYLKLDKEFRGFGGHAELRVRDGGHVAAGSNNAYLRGFFTSNVWFQEVYAYYTPGPVFKLKFGKVYRRTGIFWDDSFFGNLLYFDGHKLNPDYGGSAEGVVPLAGDRVTFSYDAQYFLQSDGINGSFEFGRTLGPVPDGGDLQALRTYHPAPEGQRDSAGTRVGVFRNTVNGRVGFTFQPHKRFGVSVGGSALTAVIRRASTADGYRDQARMSHAGGDLTLQLGPATVFAEYVRQYGPGVRDADYVWTGARATWKRVSLRFNASYVRYHLPQPVEEYILQPGVTVTIGGGLAALVEYNEWQRRNPQAYAGYTSYDRSLNFVLAYSY